MSQDSDIKNEGQRRRRASSLRVPDDPVPRSAKSVEDVLIPSIHDDVPTLITEDAETAKIEAFEDNGKTEVAPTPQHVAKEGEGAIAEAVIPTESGELIDDDMLEEIENSNELEEVSIDMDDDAYDSVELDENDDDVQELGAENSSTPPTPPPIASTKSAPRMRRTTRSWVEQVFNEDYLRTLPFLTPKATKMEATFVAESLGLDPGAQVLDVACGYGRHAMELAAQGYHLVGLDSSLPLLLRGADEAQRRGLTINFVHGDMREMDFETQFDGAYCLFSSFGFFDDDVNKKTAQHISDSLKPGAKFVIEVLNRDYLVSDLPSRVWWEGDGCVVLEEVAFNYFSSRIISNRSVVFDDGRQLEQEISMRSFSLHELGKLLHAVGFRVVEISGSMATRGRFFGAYSRDIVVVAEKRAT